MKGFLLTRQWRDTPDGVQLDCWLASDAGPLRLIIPPQPSVCFVPVDSMAQLEPILNKIPQAYCKPVNLKNFYGQAVLAVYLKQQKNLRSFSQQLNDAGIPVWEDDIKPTDRFFMERFITAGISIEGPQQIDQSGAYQTITSQRLKPSQYLPSLSVLSVDIETSMDANELYSIAAYSNKEARVFVVSHPEQKQRTSSEGVVYYPTAKRCLQAFIAWFNGVDPDVIVGWHVVQFDLNVLQNFCDRWQLKFAIGRANQTLNWREDGKQAGRRYVQIPGRVVLDGIELLRTAFYNFESFSLQYVATELLGESKLITEHNRGQAISDLYYRDPQALAEYNLQDCKLVWDIYKAENLLAFAIERSRLTGMALDRMGGSVASFDYAYLPRLHRAGYVAPNLGELQSDVVSPGGYVMRSKPGLYRQVLVFDFKSLYPSIIRTFNIDPYAFWLAQHDDLSGEEVIPGFNNARFARQHAILPEIIYELWQARDQAKKQSNQALSQAIKIIMNSFYGVLGSSGCRFFDPRVCSSITLRGHEIIQRSRDWIEQQGYDVIYGDTDSVFVWLGNDIDDHSADTLGQNLAQGLNEWWQQTLVKEFSIDSALEVEFETHYTHFFMPTIRGSKEGSKKRYAGIVVNNNDQNAVGSLVFKGLETVRTDWTQLAKQFQQDLYRLIFLEEPYRDFIRQTVTNLRSGGLNDSLVYKKRLRRPLEQYEKTSPPHVKAARKLMALTGKLLGRGDRIHYAITVNGPEPVEVQQSPIDYQHYIDKQLKPIADSILGCLDDSFEAIIDDQLVLL